MGGALNWKTQVQTARDGCQLAPPLPIPESSCVKGDDTQEVIKPFCAVPALKLPKDRAWAHPSLFCWAQPGARNWEGAHKLMDGSSLLCYPHSCQHFQKPMLPEAAPDPSSPPAMGHRSCWWQLQGASWSCSKPENLTLSWC